MKDLKVIFKPTSKNIKEIEEWGFEKSCLYSSYNNNLLVVAEYSGFTVGYYCLRKNDKTIEIDVAEIKEDFRGKGLGKMMFDKIEKEFLNSKIFGFKLHCSPKESQFYWKKLGFEYFPKSKDEDKLRMFKLIKPNVSFSLNEDVNKFIGNYILIKDDFKLKYFFKIEFKKDSNELLFPVIFFGNHNWNMIVNINEKEVFNNRFKDFNRKQEIYDCIFINEIPIKYL